MAKQWNKVSAGPLSKSHRVYFSNDLRSHNCMSKSCTYQPHFDAMFTEPWTNLGQQLWQRNDKVFRQPRLVLHHLLVLLGAQLQANNNMYGYTRQIKVKNGGQSHTFKTRKFTSTSSFLSLLHPLTKAHLSAGPPANRVFTCRCLLDTAHHDFNQTGLLTIVHCWNRCFLCRSDQQSSKCYLVHYLKNEMLKGLPSGSWKFWNSRSVWKSSISVCVASVAVQSNSHPPPLGQVPQAANPSCIPSL